MKGYIANIEKLSITNENFRKVLYTDKNTQLVVMSLVPKESIGEEVHDVDQFIRVEQGNGRAVLHGSETEIHDGSAVIIPAGTRHNVINDGGTPMKLYTLYTPPHHKDGTIHKTKEDAQSDDEHFDGIITEQK
jgi:mannose-6-phosphate isomerase-like protein (cupin superfamily)